MGSTKHLWFCLLWACTPAHVPAPITTVEVGDNAEEASDPRFDPAPPGKDWLRIGLSQVEEGPRGFLISPELIPKHAKINAIIGKRGVCIMERSWWIAYDGDVELHGYELFFPNKADAAEAYELLAALSPDLRVHNDEVNVLIEIDATHPEDPARAAPRQSRSARGRRGARRASGARRARDRDAL